MTAHLVPLQFVPLLFVALQLVPLHFVPIPFCLITSLTKEPLQVIPSIWPHILLIGRTHRLDKTSRRIFPQSLLLLRYGFFNAFRWLTAVVPLKDMKKTHCWISTWNFAYRDISVRAVYWASSAVLNAPNRKEGYHTLSLQVTLGYHSHILALE